MCLAATNILLFRLETTQLTLLCSQARRVLHWKDLKKLLVWKAPCKVSYCTFDAPFLFVTILDLKKVILFFINESDWNSDLFVSFSSVIKQIWIGTLKIRSLAGGINVCPKSLWWRKWTKWHSSANDKDNTHITLPITYQTGLWSPMAPYAKCA